MEESTKNPASKVDPDPADVAPLTNPIIKGKRDADEVVEKQDEESKKQKVNDDLDQAVENDNFGMEKVDPDPEVVAPPTDSINKGKRDAYEVVEKQDVESKKQKIVNGDSNEKNNFETEKENDTEFPSAAVNNAAIDEEKVEVPMDINAQDAEGVNKSEKDEGDNISENPHSESPNKSPITCNATGSKTVLMDNLSFLIKEEDVKIFFKSVGEIARVHFDVKEDYFLGRGHVEFTTAEAAQEALKLNNELLLDQPVKLNLVTESVENPKTTTHQATGSKSLYVGNLSFSIEEDDVRDFFKDVGEISEIRFAIRDDRFLGYAHVDFNTAEAVQQALKLNKKELLDRAVKLDLARERGAYTRGSSVEKYSQKGWLGQVHPRAKTVFIRGFDTSEGVDNIKSALEKHFAKCGEISRLSVPKVYETGLPKGVAFIDFSDSYGLRQALRLDGSEVGERRITVEEARNQSNESRDSGDGWGRESGASGSSWHRDDGWHRESSRRSESSYGGSWHRDRGGSSGGWRKESGGYGGGMRRESGGYDRSFGSREGGSTSGYGRYYGGRHKGSGYGGGWHRESGYGGGMRRVSGGGYGSGGGSRYSSSSSSREGRFSGSHGCYRS